MVDLDVIRTEDESAGITSFQDMAVQTGAQMTGTIQAGGEIQTCSPARNRYHQTQLLT